MGDKASRFDPNFTQHVIDTIGPKTDARSREVLGALIRHLHDFAREIELTVDEWMLGVRFVNSIGQISDAKRNEGQRISDVLGLESCVLLLSLLFRAPPLISNYRLVDEIAHKLVSENGTDPTSSSILGPFWSPNAPFREPGASIVQDHTPNGQPSLMHGKVVDLVTGKGIPNAVVDIWQASSNGDYHFYCLKPTAYSLPTDGPAGVLLNLLDRHPMRPAHIHLMVSNFLTNLVDVCR
jgi:catechol 1,2-dioxygenase